QRPRRRLAAASAGVAAQPRAPCPRSWASASAAEVIELQDRRAGRTEDAIADEDPVRRILVRAVPWATTSGVFTEQLLAAEPAPEQGWKLHVSASVASAPAVLERTLPLLLDEGVAFKVVGTARALLVLNSGGYGASQVGKF